MSFLVWNCRGLAQPRAVRFLKEIIQQLRPNLVFLSETLVKKEKIEKICKDIGFADYCAVDAQGHGGGLALFWKTEGGVTVRDVCHNYIDFEVVNEQIGRWRYTGYYGFPERGRRRESWNMLEDLAGKSSLPWCIIGDFNYIVSRDEKQGGRVQPRWLMEGFSDASDRCELSDLGFIGDKFTWEKSRGSSSWVQERLDRGMATQAWKDLFPQAEVRVVDVTTSDHLSLYLYLNRRIFMPKVRRFRFENMWIKENECFNIVKDCWNGREGADIMSKLLLCCAKLEEWGGGMVQEIRAKLNMCRVKMRKLRSRRDGQGLNEYNDVRWEYLGLLEKQEVFWKQRAKQFRLKEGDANSRFFHKFASVRKKK
ncbi:uncharacterized protein LOC141692145 [Apium graveolens]|uniref:uncharacterized protein LOC141692145 n=1 Tax=Apium graveolens TaxID=4045 RepID=UPI003D7B81C7